jgi:hypothetical protein
MPVYNTQRRAKARTFLSIAASPKCLTVTASLTLDLTILGSNPGKLSSQSYAPSTKKQKTYFLLSNGPEFVYVEVFNRDVQRVNISAISCYS